MIFSRMKKVMKKRSTSLLPTERAARACPAGRRLRERMLEGSF
jgi:hypothetical protein